MELKLWPNGLPREYENGKRIVGLSGFGWLGNHYWAIGRTAHPQTKRWWQRLTGSIPIDAAIMIPWICWLLSILSGVTYQYAAVKYLEKLEEEHGNLIYRRVEANALFRALVKNPYRMYGFLMINFYFGTAFFTIVAIVRLIIKVSA